MRSAFGSVGAGQTNVVSLGSTTGGNTAALAYGEEKAKTPAELAAEVFGATHAEIRCASGAMANLYGFMALAKPGDAIIAPPPAVGGHVTHHKAGCAGLYGLVTHDAPVNADGYTVDLDGLRALAIARGLALPSYGEKAAGEG